MMVPRRSKCIKDLSRTGQHLNRKTEARYRPDEERPRCGCDIGLFSGEVDVSGSGDGVDVGTKKKEVNENIRDLGNACEARMGRKVGHSAYFEKDTIRPGRVV